MTKFSEEEVSSVWLGLLFASIIVLVYGSLFDYETLNSFTSILLGITGLGVVVYCLKTVMNQNILVRSGLTLFSQSNSSDEWVTPPMPEDSGQQPLSLDEASVDVSDQDNQEDDEIQVSLFQIQVPKQTPWQPQHALALMQGLYDLIDDGFCDLRIVAQSSGISWQVFIGQPEDKIQPRLTRLVTSLYPNALVTSHSETPKYPFYRRTVVLQRQQLQTYFDVFPEVTGFRSADPLILIGQTMSQLQADETLTVTLSIASLMQMTDQAIQAELLISEYDAGARYKVQRQPSLRIPTRSRSHIEDSVRLAGTILGTATRFVINRGREFMANQSAKKRMLLRYSEKDHEVYQAKLSQKLALASIGVYFDSPEKKRLTTMPPVNIQLKNISDGYPLYAVDGMDETKRVTDYITDLNTMPMDMFQTWLTEVANSEEPMQAPYYDFLLTANETASIWHLPHEGFTETSNVQWVSSTPNAIIAKGDDHEIPIGTLASGETAVLSRPDRRYHTYVSGMTGMGKSTLLHNLIHRDIQTGEGIAVIDPHETLIKKILQESIPKKRLNDVVYLKCDDGEYPIPLNPLRTPEGVDTDTVFNTVLWVLKSIYASSWSESRMETTARYILQLLIQDPEATPLDIQELVNNKTFRANLIQKLKDSGVRLPRATRNYWRDFEHLSPSEIKDRTAPILHRLSAFLGTGHLELMSCHPQTINFRQLIQQKKIVLINLSGATIANEVGSLGAIFFANFFLHSMTFGTIDADNNEPPRFYLYIDDARRFITDPIDDMFSEARNFGLAVTMASQFIGQFDMATQNEINKNVGNRISFKSDQDDAQRVAKFYKPAVTPEDIIKFDVGQAAVKTMVESRDVPAFTVTTLPPVAAKRHPKSVEETEVITQSRQNLGLITADEVDEFIDKRYDGDMYSKPPTTSGMSKFEGEDDNE